MNNNRNIPTLLKRIRGMVLPRAVHRDTSGTPEQADPNAPRCRNCGAVLDYGAVKCDACGRKTVEFNLR